MKQLFRQLMKAEPGNNLSLMLFALVEVVMIVVGIVMANNLEEQKEIGEVTERARCCSKKCFETLTDCWAAYRPLMTNRENNRLSDVLYNPIALWRRFRQTPSGSTTSV